MLTTSEIYHDTRILNEAAALSKKYKVKILAKKYPAIESDKVRRPFEVRLIDYKKMPFSKLNIFAGQYALSQAAKQESPDVFHAHDLDGLLCAYSAARGKRKLLVYDSHELWSKNYPFSNLRGIRWLLGPLEKFLMRKVKAGITVNISIARYLKKIYHKNFIAIHNYSLNVKNVGEVSLKKLFPEKKIILHLGSADEGRGLEQIIMAAKYLPNNCVIVFLGGGKIELQAKKMAKEIRAKNIAFLPAVMPREIISSIKEADLGLALTQKISLSYYYSLPNKLFQYIGAGLPILGSNFPEFRRVIVNHRIGEVVNPANPKMIARKIKIMLKKSSQNKYRKHLVNLEKKFSWENEAKKLVNFYENIFNEKVVERKSLD